MGITGTILVLSVGLNIVMYSGRIIVYIIRISSAVSKVAALVETAKDAIGLFIPRKEKYHRIDTSKPDYIYDVHTLRSRVGKEPMIPLVRTNTFSSVYRESHRDYFLNQGLSYTEGIEGTENPKDIVETFNDQDTETETVFDPEEIWSEYSIN